jgi:6-phosphogluconolactonase
MIVVVSGISVSGTSTVGALLAAALKCAFIEGDDDRRPSLTAVHSRILDLVRRGDDVVVACAALTGDDRRLLATGLPITWVYLRASGDDTLALPEDAIVVDASLHPSVIVERLLPLLGNAVDVRVSSNAHDLSAAVARAASQLIADTVAANGTCSLALAGGNTPRELYRLLASTFRERIPWDRVRVFWGDERYVPHDQPDSNFRMAKEVLLDHVPCRVEHIHPVPTHLPTADLAALEYERTLKHFFGTSGPSFDLNLLGIGEDGHTASIFPGSEAVTEARRWVVGVETDADPPTRITLTLPALTHSAHLYVMAAGSRKASALRNVLTATSAPAAYPAAGLHRSKGKLVWWVDHDAASGLDLRSTHD